MKQETKTSKNIDSVKSIENVLKSFLDLKNVLIKDVEQIDGGLSFRFKTEISENESTIVLGAGAIVNSFFEGSLIFKEKKLAIDIRNRIKSRFNDIYGEPVEENEIITEWASEMAKKSKNYVPRMIFTENEIMLLVFACDFIKMAEGITY